VGRGGANRVIDIRGGIIKGVWLGGMVAMVMVRH